VAKRTHKKGLPGGGEKIEALWQCGVPVFFGRKPTPSTGGFFGENR
jgi:hypothetical protein